MEIKIRIFQPLDYKACRLLWGELTQHHREIYSDQNIGGEDPSSGFESYLKNEKLHEMWVAVFDEKVIGFTGLIVTEKEGEVEPVIVSSVYRGKGVGKMLVERVIEEAKTLGIKFLTVNPVARNIDAISFFVNAGFNMLGHIDLFQDLSDSSEREWRTGITIHDKKLRY